MGYGNACRFVYQRYNGSNHDFPHILVSNFQFYNYIYNKKYSLGFTLSFLVPYYPGYKAMTLFPIQGQFLKIELKAITK